MKIKKIDKIYLISVRYLILFCLIFTIKFIYWLFTDLTIYSVAGLLKLFFKEVVINNNFIIVDSSVINIVSACVAGSAYLLLLILNLSVPMNFKKRVYSILLSFLILFIVNVLRIVLLTILYVDDYVFFDFSHKLFWYFFSSLFVIIIWFLMVWVFKIKEIPVHSDVKYFLKQIFKRKCVKKSKKKK